MGIWVKSQAQKQNGRTAYLGLVKCNWFSLRDYADKYVIDGGITDPSDEDNGFWLGEYSTEVEAFQVLEMIANQLFEYEHAKCCPDIESKYFKPIFYMPDSGFSESEAK